MRHLLLVALVVASVVNSAVAGDVKAIEPDAKAGRSLAIVLSGGPLVHTGQIYPPGASAVPTPPDDQVRQAFSRLDETLKAASSRLAHTIKLNVYVSHPSVTPFVDAELAMRFAGKTPPAVSLVQTSLTDPVVMVALDAIAQTGIAPERVVRAKPTRTDRPAPSAILPDGPQVYISGQAEKGDGTLADATRQTMASLISTLQFLELSPADVVHVKAFLAPINQSGIALKEIVSAFPDQTAPPVSLVEWDSTTPIEIELIAASPQRNGAPRLEFLTPPGMNASPVFCRVVRVNMPQRIFVSGLFGTKGGPDEIRDLFGTLTRAVEAGGGDLKHLAKATYYVSDEGASKLLNDLRPEFYDPARPPAASKAKVAGVGRAGRTVTLDMIAVPRE